MAEYVESFGSKLDWAMPFQRTGKFPIDRTSMFSSYADALAYAKQDGTDSRKLGGTSYIGQPITVYGKGSDGQTDEVALYLITAVGAGAALQKLAQSSASGDVGADIAALQARCSEIEADIVEINDKLVVATTSTNGLMAAADKLKLDGIAAGAQANVIEVVKLNGSPLEVTAKAVNIDLANYATKQDLTTIPKFAIQVVAELPTQDISTTTVYLVLQEEGEQNGQDIYNEYIYVNNKWELIGNTDVDLSAYATTEAMNAAIQEAVEGMATQGWVTEQLAGYATTEALGNKADTSTVTAIGERVTAAEGEIDTLQTDVAGKVAKTEMSGYADGTTITYSGNKFSVGTVPATKVSGKVASAAAADTATRVANELHFGEDSYDGSAEKTITAEAIGAATPSDIGSMTVKVGETTVASSADGNAATLVVEGSGTNVHVTGSSESGKITIAVDNPTFTDTNREIKVDGTQMFAASNKAALNFGSTDTISIQNISSGTAIQMSVKDASINAAKLGANAVVAEKIAANAVVADKIAAGAVNSAKLANDAVTTVAIANTAVTDAKIDTMNATKLFLNEEDTLIFDCGTAE